MLAPDASETIFAVPWEEALIIIFFFYGLAFYSMGLALFVESGRASELGFARSMRLLAGFGILHGIHEWLDMTQQGVMVYHHLPIYTWLMWVRLAILVTSFLSLLLFGEQLLGQANMIRKPYWRITVGAALWYAISCIVVRVTYQLSDETWLEAADVLARYILGISSGLLACWALWRQRAIFRERGMDLFVRDLTVAAISLALYGVVGQFFAQPSTIFPSNVINSEMFQGLLGFPIQLFRAVTAGIVAISMIRVLRALEVENQQRLSAIERSRLETEAMSREELARLNAELQDANHETARLLQEVQQRDAVRGELLQRITNAQEAERQRIARELHDETGQALTGLALGLRGLASQTTLSGDALAGRLRELEAMATSSMGELRHLINDLRPPQLDDMGLAAALRWLVDRFQNGDKSQFRLDVRGTPHPLPSEIETTLFRIAQEGLNNAIKHAQADQIWVTLDYRDGVALTVSDDGKGFDPETAMNPSTRRTSWGLIGIEERTNLINAALTLQSAPGSGTTFTVRLNEPPSTEVSDADQSTHR
ncbi:MAG: sensor histidine kinase [Anaerolineae bacterium]